MFIIRCDEGDWEKSRVNGLTRLGVIINSMPLSVAYEIMLGINLHFLQYTILYF